MPGRGNRDKTPSVPAGEEGGQGGGHAADRHGLEDDAAGAGDHRVEEALAAEEGVLYPLHGLNVDGAGGIHHGQVAGVYHHPLPGGELILHGVAVHLQEGHARAGELLHDEALAAEEAGPCLLLEEDRHLHPLLRGQKAGLLDHDGPVGGDLHRPDGAGEAGGKSDHAGAALGGVDVLEEGLAGEHPAEGLAQAAAGVGAHLHVGAHPNHGALLCDHGLSALQVTDDHRHGLANNVVLHVMRLLILLVNLSCFQTRNMGLSLSYCLPAGNTRKRFDIGKKVWYTVP